MFDLSTVKAVILDLDGTLVDSAPDLAYALNNSLAKLDLPAHSVSSVRNMIGGGVPKLIERGLLAHNADASIEVIEEILPGFLEFYGANATRETYLYPGAIDLLSHLKEQSVPTALCTNKPTEATGIILENLNLTDYFVCVIGGTSGFPKKPDPLSLKYILSEMDAAPATTLMIGDSGVDVGAARGAEMPVAIMSYGYSKTPASELGADMVFDSFTEILTGLIEARSVN